VPRPLAGYVRIALAVGLLLLLVHAEVKIYQLRKQQREASCGLIHLEEKLNMMTLNAATWSWAQFDDYCQALGRYDGSRCLINEQNAKMGRSMAFRPLILYKATQ
jgi:hypothetical protein